MRLSNNYECWKDYLEYSRNKGREAFCILKRKVSEKQTVCVTCLFHPVSFLAWTGLHGGSSFTPMCLVIEEPKWDPSPLSIFPVLQNPLPFLTASGSSACRGWPWLMARQLCSSSGKTLIKVSLKLGREVFSGPGFSRAPRKTLPTLASRVHQQTAACLLLALAAFYTCFH